MYLFTSIRVSEYMCMHVSEYISVYICASEYMCVHVCMCMSEHMYAQKHDRYAQCQSGELGHMCPLDSPSTPQCTCHLLHCISQRFHFKSFKERTISSHCVPDTTRGQTVCVTTVHQDPMDNLTVCNCCPQGPYKAVH